MAHCKHASASSSPAGFVRKTVMHLLDRYAYSNRIRSVDPIYKTGFAVTVLLLCLVLNKPWVGLATVAWIWMLAVYLAGLPAATFGRVLFAEMLFVLLATAGVAISISAKAPSPVAGWGLRIGSLWFSTNSDALSLAFRLVTRTLGCTAAMNFLAMTTPLVDLVDLLRRLHVPPVLIDLMTVMYRFIFVLLDSFQEMYVAQESRLGYSSLYRGIVSAGQLGSRLFIDAFQRSQRLQIALESRAYNGELRVLPSQYERSDALLILSLAVAASLLVVWRAL